MIVYKTTNKVNNKIYVGKDESNDPNYLGSGLILNNAIEKYGRDNFIKETLQVCKTREETNKAEKYWIEKLNSRDRSIGYNIASGGTGGDTLSTHPNKKEIAEKAIAWKKGKKYEDIWDADTVKKMKDEMRARMNLKNKGKTWEEMYGSEKAQQMREKRSKNKGKTWEEIYGTEKAQQMREKRKKK